jgi:Flp pilus assembly protein TadD
MRAYFCTPMVLVGVLLLNGCAARSGVASRAVTKSGTFATVESSDRQLGAALLIDAVHSTASSRLQVAREYARLDILDMAQSWTSRALEREPRFAEGHEFMARIWRDWHLAGVGLRSAHLAVRYDHGSASAHNTLGTLLDALGQVDEARSAYTVAVALDPNAEWALNNLCYLEMRAGRFDDALRACERALAVSPGLVVAHNNLALTYAASGAMSSASAAFLAAGDLASAYYNIGIVHLAGRRYADAAAAFEHAIKLRPTFTEAKRWAHDARMRLLTAK